MKRRINPKPIKPPRELTVSDLFSRYHLEDMCHIPGQAAAIEFFDPDSKEDYLAIRAIMESRDVRTWMDDAGKISYSDYKSWAGKYTNESFLFAVHDARLLRPEDIKEVRGFVNVYSERSEKFRIRRLRKARLLPGNLRGKHVLEVSMALRQTVNSSKSGSGLMSSALRQSCLQVRSLLDNPRRSKIILFGFVDKKNVASKRAMEAAGFVEKGETKYDNDSPDSSFLYVLSWRKLYQKVREKMVNKVGGYMKVIPEPQMTDSHCGPAVVRGLLRYHQVDVGQDEVVKSVRLRSRIERDGMRPIHMYKAIKILAPHLRFWYKLGATAKDIKTLIYKCNLPVGINWQGLFYDTTEEEKKKDPTGDHGHHSIVVDLKSAKAQITIDDPYSEYFNIPRVFSYRWFRKRWWDIDSIKGKDGQIRTLKFSKLLFVVTPIGFKFPSKLDLEPGENLVELERTYKHAETASEVDKAVVEGGTDRS